MLCPEVSTGHEFYTEARVRRLDRDNDVFAGVNVRPSRLNEWAVPVIDVWTAPSPADYFTASGIGIFSSRLRAVVEEYNSNVQWLPVEVHHAPSRYFKEQRWVAHFLEHIECVDWENSAVTTAGSSTRPMILSATKLVLQSDRVDALGIGYCGGLKKICVSDDFARRVTSYPMPSVKFVDTLQLMMSLVGPI